MKMKIQIDLLKIPVPDKSAVLVRRDWWAWVLHCNGCSNKRIAQELFVPRGYVRAALHHARHEWVTYLDLQDHCTWN